MEHAHLKRRLTAVLLADVVAYSRLMSVDEEGTHVRLADHVKELIEPRIAEYRGRSIRSMGDGLLAEFDSAVDAVRCALAIQSELAEREAGLASDRRMKLRIGINTGDVIVDQRDIYGNSVNIAARLEGLAEPGEVYVTRGVRDQLEGHPNLAFEDGGDRRVKNIAHPIRVYRVKRTPAPAKQNLRQMLITLGRRFSPARFRFRSRATVLSTAILATAVTLGTAGLPVWRDQWRTAPRSSIMVLPFSNLSNDPGQEYFADAITDDLTTDLSRLPSTFVIARGTAFTYKGKVIDARQIGQECGVRYLLEGSIKRTDSQLQTNARLVDTASAAQIWADRFDTEVIDLFELERAVTGRIASALDIQLVKAEARRVINERAASPDAIDIRLRGMSLYFSSVTPEHSQAARRYLEEALRLDPDSAEAWSWLADILASQYLQRWNNAGTEELAEAEEAVRKAIAIDPNFALAHHADGLVHRAKGQHQAALDAFSRALELDPNFARAYAQKGNELILVGRPEEASSLVEKAIKLSPRDPSLGMFYWILGRAQFFSGNYTGAIPWLQKSVAMRPNVWYNRLYLASAFVYSGQRNQASKVITDFNSRREFKNYTLARVQADEQASPNDNEMVVAARRKLHEALREIGMAAQ